MKTTRRKQARQGFSLVEVTMAIGITGFSMLVVMGLLPVGLDSVRQSTVQVGEAGIIRQVRGDLEQLPLSGTTDSVQALNGQTYYYTQQGNKLTSSTGAYFGVTFQVTDPTTKVAGAPASFGSSALNVTVTLAYPQMAPATSQQSMKYSFLAAGS